MTDATPSRPIPTRKIKDGVVEGEPTGNLDSPNPTPPLTAAIATMRVCIDSKNNVYVDRRRSRTHSSRRRRFSAWT
jgi:hypothetical protein